MAHTPGPWAINGWDIVQQDCDNTFPSLAKACNGNGSIRLEAINANARLIAAAPELLAALKEMVMLRCLGGATVDNDSATQRAVLAINKAERSA